MSASPDQSHAVWADRLERLASTALSGSPLLSPAGPEGALAFLESFEDEKGHRRAVDRPMLARLLEISLPKPQACTPDVALWWSLLHPDPGLLGSIRQTQGPLLPGTPRDLFDPDATWDAIEVWTEAELCALQALWHAAWEDRSLEDRVDSAIAWLMENVQPDNATNHPWAAPVFIDRWIRRSDQNCRMYAGTLLHNAQVGLGRPDRFSAVILLDGARGLRLRGAAG